MAFGPRLFDHDLGVLFQDFGGCEDGTGDEFCAAGSDGVDGGLREEEGGIGRDGIVEEVFQGFVGCEECSRGGDCD